MNIVSKTEDFIVVDKEHGLPTVPLKTNPERETLLSQVALLYPQVLEVCGKNSWEGGALHRLDTATSGLVVFALNQNFYNEIMEYQDKGLFVKKYRADLSCKAVLPEKISTYFRAYGPGRKRVKPEENLRKADSPVLYVTYLKNLCDEVAECEISKGFRHQIRSHLAYLGCPIVGDSLYGGNEDAYLHLDCVEVKFPYKSREIIIKKSI